MKAAIDHGKIQELAESVSQEIKAILPEFSITKLEPGKPETWKDWDYRKQHRRLDNVLREEAKAFLKDNKREITGIRFAKEIGVKKTTFFTWLNKKNSEETIAAEESSTNLKKPVRKRTQ